MSSRDVDFLIIGQGLAGSALAWHLIHSGQRVMVIDDSHRTAASRVAAGLINPLAGMRFNRRPQVADWLQSAESWYADLAQTFGQRLLFSRPMLRLFRSTDQQRFYDRRRNDPDASHLLGKRFSHRDCPEPIAAPHGGFIQHRTGYVDLPRLLTLVRDWLNQKDSLEEQAFDPQFMTINEAGIRFGRWHARQVIFCEGQRVTENPWFKTLPLQPDKGQILTLRYDSWKPKHIINGTHWLVPLHDGLIRFGATHEHDTTSSAVTAAARTALLGGLGAMTPDHPCSIIDHQAGFRPATPDRYPFLGKTPDYPSLWVCNGFGARGALSIPWYTKKLADHLLHQQPLPAESDIERLHT